MDESSPQHYTVINMTSTKPLPKRAHVVGICGVATSALAIAFQKKGVIVTGSDKGFFPPVSTELEKQGISYYAGWHPEKMFGGLFENEEMKNSENESRKNSLINPDENIVIVGTASGSTNPETALAVEKGLPIFSYPEVIGQYFAKENSIVCAGTWGKTSSAATLSFILEQAGLDPTYMFGGISLSHESSAKLGDSKWSVFEGDEYKSSPTDPCAKFFHYKTTHLLLSAVSWDHADLYPTEKEYFNAFEKLIAEIPKDGLVVACADNEKVVQTVSSFKGKIVYYGRELPEIKKKNKNSETLLEPGSAFNSGKTDFADYYGYKNVRQNKNGLDLTITHNDTEYLIHSPMLGLYQSENITGCFAMAHTLGVPAEKIIEAISLFKGLKRRMEKRLETETIKNMPGNNSENTAATKNPNITIIDDIAHSPEKARSVLQTLHSIYSGKIITIFEPNSGGRSRESIAKYDNAFDDSDIVIIPRLTKLKVAENEKDQPIEGAELASVIGKTHSNVKFIDDDKALVEFLTTEAKDGDVIAFLGSHGFRGMIEETVEKMSG
jgi:UDP-N-acetylmuramate: L-alanyl-gamma-D-glutamyl-meso-diaminopimelate ligase